MNGLILCLLLPALGLAQPAPEPELPGLRRFSRRLHALDIELREMRSDDWKWSRRNDPPDAAEYRRKAKHLNRLMADVAEAAAALPDTAEVAGAARRLVGNWNHEDALFAALQEKNMNLESDMGRAFSHIPLEYQQYNGWQNQTRADKIRIILWLVVLAGVLAGLLIWAVTTRSRWAIGLLITFVVMLLLGYRFLEALREAFRR